MYHHFQFRQDELLARYRYVKRNFLDTLFFSGILPSWLLWWLSKRGIDAVAVLIHGCPEKVRTESHEFVPNVKARTGINLEKTRERNHNSYLKDLADGVGFEPTAPLASALHKTGAFGALVFKTSGINHSPTHPLNRWRQSESNRLALVLRTPPANLLPPSNGASGECALQTFAPHLRFQKSILYPFRFRSRYRSRWREKFPFQVLFRNRKSQHTFFCVPGHGKRPRLRPIIFDEIEKSDGRETGTASALWPVCFEHVRSIVLFLDWLNTNSAVGFVPQEKHERCLWIFPQHFRAAIVDGETPIVSERHLRSGSAYIISGEDFKRHNNPLFGCPALGWPQDPNSKRNDISSDMSVSEEYVSRKTKKTRRVSDGFLCRRF
jgi:hypothetical protein